MVYVDEILTKLENSDNWPGYERPWFLSELNELADNSFVMETVEGYLASLLIYHQLTEECMKILIDCSTFYIQLSVFPQEYKNRNLKDKMFGQLIQELNQSVLYEETHILLKKAKEFNSLRNQFVHKLTKADTIQEIKIKCEKVQTIFNEIWELFDEIYDNYKVIYKDFHKDIEEMREQIE